MRSHSSDAEAGATAIEYRDVLAEVARKRLGNTNVDFVESTYLGVTP